jgi:hypothetical protein
MRRKLTASEIWQSTQKTISTAFKRTKETLTNTYNRITNRKQDDGGKASSSGTGASASPEDKTPSRRVPSYEAEIQSGRVKPITGIQVRGSGSKELRVIPRGSLTTNDLRRQLAEANENLELERDPQHKKLLAERQRKLTVALKNSQMEDAIVREIDKIRRRLRLLEGKLEEVRKARLGKKR